MTAIITVDCITVNGAKNGSSLPAPNHATCFALIWTLRLGTFLFSRIKRDGKDGRFDALKPKWSTFLIVWVLQALWCSLTALAVFTVNASQESFLSDDYVDRTTEWIGGGIGIAIWLLGFGIEVVADNQKKVWRADPSNKGKWIDVGLWHYSRHPNYFGEATLWLGMLILCAPSFQNTQWAAVISPIFVTFLLTKVSGVPMLEQRADEKWGGNPEYEKYKRTTSVFIILPKQSETSNCCT